MIRTPADALRWVDEGTALVRRALAALGTDDAAFAAPSGLPGWSRKHLLAHLAANAAAVGNLVTWARTGVETPMYRSPGQRAAEIEAGATLPAAVLAAWFDRTARELADGWAGLGEDQWNAAVVTAQGRTVPASETPWLRAREVMVHSGDFDAGVSFADLPTDFRVALVSDIVGKRSAGGNPAVRVVPDDNPGRWQVAGDGEPVVVTGPLAEVTAWLAGRPCRNVTTTDGGPPPPLPPWL